ncbi:16487_t:CDS:2 [Dentiscutata heterogama]|uniref:16487_t:CDS:1 n=1 Tax=Dentiscutata heterogama TaxID=1316150 RepID=A0ACA9LHM0_9GLOM|nr:16487_t:CDS:2 [Dentiscutata heterogama]
MSNLIVKIENFLMKETFDAMCGATVVYLTMEDSTVPPYNIVRDLADRAVNSALTKIENPKRRMKVLEILPQDRESTPDHAGEEIEENLNLLKEKLNHPMIDTDVSLYDALKKRVNDIDPSDLSWEDPEASMVLSDNSNIVESLGPRQKRVFLEPRENMRCALPVSVASKCNEFVENFNKSDDSREMGNVFHNKRWKESETDLVKISERILGVLSEIWNNPAFATIVPLLRAALGGLPNGRICLSTAERQSLASKARRNIGTSKERMGKKPDVMVLEEYEKKIIEILYVECSRIVCDATKKADDDTKLWRETLDGVSFVSAVCRPTSNQFGIVGIQVGGESIYLNVLVKDAGGIPRYFHLDHAEIPLSSNTSWRVKPLIRLLLTLRNILIVNKSLLMQALEQASSHPPRNVNPSPTVSSPRREEAEQKRSRKNITSQSLISPSIKNHSGEDDSTNSVNLEQTQSAISPEVNSNNISEQTDDTSENAPNSDSKTHQNPDLSLDNQNASSTELEKLMPLLLLCNANSVTNGHDREEIIPSLLPSDAKTVTNDHDQNNVYINSVNISECHFFQK